jgi:hypothetical protein
VSEGEVEGAGGGADAVEVAGLAGGVLDALPVLVRLAHGVLDDVGGIADWPASVAAVVMMIGLTPVSLAALSHRSG